MYTNYKDRSIINIFKLINFQNLFYIMVIVII